MFCNLLGDCWEMFGKLFAIVWGDVWDVLGILLVYCWKMFGRFGDVLGKISEDFRGACLEDLERCLEEV